MKNVEQLVEEGARNVLANAGVSEAEAATHLSNYFAGCEDVLRRLFQGELDKLARALRGVTAPPRDEGKAIAARETVFARGEHAGWISKEIDFAFGALAPGESLVSFTFDCTRTSEGRSLDRAALRAANRPASWSRDDTWFAQFPKIERHEERQ
jgi:hypothetical protein